MAEGNSDNTDPWFGQLMAQPQMLAYLIQVDFGCGITIYQLYNKQTTKNPGSLIRRQDF